MTSIAREARIMLQTINLQSEHTFIKGPGGGKKIGGWIHFDAKDRPTCHLSLLEKILTSDSFVGIVGKNVFRSLKTLFQRESDHGRIGANSFGCPSSFTGRGRLSSVVQETVGGGAGSFFSLNADFEFSLGLRPTVTLRRGGEQIVRLQVLFLAQYLSKRGRGEGGE